MKRKSVSCILVLCLMLSCFIQASAKKKDPTPDIVIQDSAIERIGKLSGGELKVNIHENNGTHVNLSGKLSKRMDISEGAVLSYLEENKSIFGLSGKDQNFKVLSLEKDELGYTKVKINQLINQCTVMGREFILHLDSDGIITDISGSVMNDIKEVSKLDNDYLTPEEAAKIAENEFSSTGLKKVSKAEKVIIVLDNTAYEVYKVNIYYTEPEIANWDVFVETSSGKIIEKQSNLRYDGAVTGSGKAVDGTTKSLNLYQYSTSYQMIDTTKPMTGQVKTYTANNRQTQPGTIVSNTSTTFTTENFKASVSAHYYSGLVYDFYKLLFNRNSINNNGMSVVSTTHYGSSYNNAFWDGTQMVYGDGDGTQFTYLSGDLDVVAHELTHGITQYTANLVYSNQSGALNESMSDVFGVLIDTYDKYNVKNGGAWTFNAADWVVGDKIYTPQKAGDAMRSLSNPKLYGQPDNMSGYVITSSDNGGVHTNSGIPNKAAFLVAQSIGCEKTARIYYRALNSYMTANTDFLAARNALVSAATDLYGSASAEVIAVNNAFNSVGVVAVNDPYEPNNTSTQAYPIISGTTYSSYIASSADVDFYKLTASSGKSISVNLTNLPKDYDLYLYNSSGTVVARSEYGSTTSESISYTASYTGTYFILVKGYNGVYSTTTKYNLKATFQ
ncbi:MAG: M4 family metallopeptidase [Clostridia bacterium]|nr:M4 family metallopeptidase [Clostridia bacterium]